MASDISFDIEGLREMEAAFAELGQNIGNKALRHSIRQASKPMLEAAKRNAPVSSGRSVKSGTKVVNGVRKSTYKKVPGGTLRANIKFRLPRTNRNNRVTGFLGLRSRKVYYANWVHFGTQPHNVSRNSKREKWYFHKGSGTWKKYKRSANELRGSKPVKGAKANPFLLRALQQEQANFFRIFQAEMAKKLKTAQRKAARDKKRAAM